MVMNDSVSKAIRERCEELVIDDNVTVKLMDLISKEINKGLSKKENKTADVKCHITYVHNLPNGTVRPFYTVCKQQRQRSDLDGRPVHKMDVLTSIESEKGKFLGLDLGGTNVRVLLVQLNGEIDFEVKSATYNISQKLMLGSCEQLFDYLADCVANFMKDQRIYSERLSLGFTFSFELEQVGVRKALLIKWAKGFNCSNAIGEDVVQLLQEAIARRADIEVDVCAILNDTTGTLLSCAWRNHNCKIALIIGTGTNACYVEKIENIENYTGQPVSNMIINTEWAALGECGTLEFIRTDYDREVDYHSSNRGSDIFEKMISGMYIGELVRLSIQTFVKNGFIFDGIDSDLFRTRGLFLSKYVSDIESDDPGTYLNLIEIMNNLGIQNVTEQDCADVRYICECFSRRAAHLISAGVAALINKIDEPSVTVGVDGSMYRCHPKLHDLMIERIKQFVKPKISFELILSEDGSGIGAALLAAAVCREDQCENQNT